MLESLLLILALGVSPIADSDWADLTYVSVTYYNQELYAEPCRRGETPSGLRCVWDADVIALGPRQLRSVRNHYAGHEEEVGAFSLLPCWSCEPVFWGYLVRLCTDEYCRVLRVADTGSLRLQADLPPGTWCAFGYKLEQGRFDAVLQVLKE